MTCLTDLPPDLLSRTFDYLSRREYHALRQICRALNKEATPYLYRDIRFTATDSGKCARKLASLLQTMLERPHLVRYVTAFRLFGSHSSWEKYDLWPESNERLTSVKLWGFDGRTLLRPDMFHHFVDGDMKISQALLRSRSKDALAALVMTQLTNLNTLELGDGFLRYSVFLPQIIRRIDYLFPDIDRVVLGDRQLGCDGMVPYVDLDLIRPVFYSSTVKVFEWTMAQPWQFRWNEPEAPWNTKLTSLRLFRTNITRSTLYQLLSATPNLKDFQYEQEIMFNSSTPSAPSLAPFLELDGLNSALSCAKDSLEKCQLILRLAPGSISTIQYASSGIQFPAIEGTLSVLKDMPRLTAVEVPMVMLLGWSPRSYARLEELLPPNITDLILRDDFLPYCCWSRLSSRERRIARIGRYIKDRADHAPHLASLKIRLTSAKDCLQDAVQNLSLSSDTTGVQTTVLQGTKSKTYCWRFEQVKGELGRPELGERADSVFRPRSLEDRSTQPKTRIP